MRYSLPRVKEEEIFIGTTLIPVAQITKTRIIKPELINAIKGIPEGFGRQTTLSRHQAFALLKRMERMGTIDEREFHVRSFKEGNETKVVILHERRGEFESTSSVPRNLRADTLERYHIPSKDKFVAFIEAQPNYEHDAKTLAEKLVGSVVDSHTKNVAYRVLTSVAEQARNDIVQRKGGRFVQEIRGRLKVYKWEK